MTTPRIKHISDYRTPQDPDGIDLYAIQRALDDGDGIVVLEKRNNLGNGVLQNNNTNFITYFGEGKAELKGTNTRKIDNYSNLKITHVTSYGNGFIALFTSKYDFLEVSNCEFFKSVNQAVIRIASGGKEEQYPAISTVTITHNYFENSSVTFLDRLESKRVVFAHNSIRDFQRFVLRIQFNDADSSVDQIVFDQNYIDGNLPPFSRYHSEVSVFQALAKESIHYTRNVVKNLLNEIYPVQLFLLFSSGGNVFMSNNYFENIRGLKSYLIQDKNRANHIWHIHDNVFDQRSVKDPFPASFGNSSIINVANNTSVISNNVFLHPKSSAILLGNSAISSDYPEFPHNCMISNNSFVDVQNHTAITVIQAGKNITIQGNKVTGISNPSDKPGNKEIKPRFIAFVNTKAGALIENVVIRENSLMDVQKDSVLLWSYSRDEADGVKDIKLLNNYMDSGQTLIRFRGNPINKSEIMMNILPAGTSRLYVEGNSEPVGLRAANNVLD